MHPVGRRAGAGLEQLAEAAHQPGNGEASDNRSENAYVAKRIHFDYGQAYLARRSQATQRRPHSMSASGRGAASLRSATLEQWKSTTFFCDRVAHACRVLVLASRQNGLLISHL